MIESEMPAFRPVLSSPTFSKDAPVYDDPDGCEFVIAVGVNGSYTPLSSANLWVFETEPVMQDCGFPLHFDKPPGVYRMTFTFRMWNDPETGYPDDWEFSESSCQLLWGYRPWRYHL